MGKSFWFNVRRGFWEVKGRARRTYIAIRDYDATLGKIGDLRSELADVRESNDVLSTQLELARRQLAGVGAINVVPLKRNGVAYNGSISAAQSDNDRLQRENDDLNYRIRNAVLVLVPELYLEEESNYFIDRRIEDRIIEDLESAIDLSEDDD